LNQQIQKLNDAISELKERKEDLEKKTSVNITRVSTGAKST